MSDQLTAEIVTFRPQPGTTPETMAAAAASIAGWLAGCPGFVARTAWVTPDGLWTDHVLWQSPAQAQAAGQRFMAEQGDGPYMAAIDPDSVTMTHAPVRVRQTV